MDKEQEYIKEIAKEDKRAYYKMYQENNRAKYNQYQKEYKQKNKDKVKKWTINHYIKVIERLKQQTN